MKDGAAQCLEFYRRFQQRLLSPAFLAKQMTTQSLTLSHKIHAVIFVAEEHFSFHTAR
jgi:hypothetical protein